MLTVIILSVVVFTVFCLLIEAVLQRLYKRKERWIEAVGTGMFGGLVVGMLILFTIGA